MTNSINTNIAAYFAQANIGRASDMATASVSRLSSGNKIVKASDDVAALSIGTALRTGVSALRTALVNASQGSSLLQVADGALSQVTEILQRQRAIAFTAGSGTLQDSDRVFLNQEFQALTQEVDRLTGSTNFNGVRLLNGALSTAAGVSSVSTAANGGSQTITINAQFTAGQTITIGGVTLVATPADGSQVLSGTDNSVASFRIGSDVNDTVNNIVNKLRELQSNNTIAAGRTTSYAEALGQANFGVSANGTGNDIVVTSRSGGSLANNFTSSTTGVSASLTGTNNLVLTGTGTSDDLRISLANSGLVVGQYVYLNNIPAVGGLTIAAGRYQVTRVTGSDFDVDLGTTAGGTTTPASGGTNSSVVADSGINSFPDGRISGGFSSFSFNLFANLGSTAGTPTASVTAANSGAAAAGTTPFVAGDIITATVGNTTVNLYTLQSGDSLRAIVDGINANSGTSGFKAALVYDGTNYNIRLSTNTNQGAVRVSLGNNFVSGTASGSYGLAGNTINSSAAATTAIGALAATSRSSVFATNYIDLLGSAMNATDVGATVISAAVGSTSTTAAFAVGDNISITINGSVLNLATIAASETFNTLVAKINANSTLTGVTAFVTGTAGSFNIRLFTSADASAVPSATANRDVISLNTGTNRNAAAAAATGTATVRDNSGSLTSAVRNSAFGLSGALDNGLGMGSVSVRGTTGDNILTSLAQTRANSSFIFTSNPVPAETITIGGKVFTFSSNSANRGVDEVLIGASISETIDNLISTIQRYLNDGNATGAQAFELNQMAFARSGTNTFTVTGKGLGNIKTLTGGDSTLAVSNAARISLTNATLNNSASTFGVDTTGINNAAFQGRIQGFRATYTGVADTVNLSIKIGDYTYTAANVDMTNTSDARIRLYSDTVGGKNGGYFDIQLDAGNVSGFNNQAGADAIASRLNVAFTTLTFDQKRSLGSYGINSKGENLLGGISANGAIIGSLVGTSVSAQFANYANVRLSDIRVTAPTGSATDARITLVINGVNYNTSVGLGTKLGANQTFRLVSEADVNQYIEFTTGNSVIDISGATNAAAVESALKTAFGATSGSAALSFQIGSASTDTLAVSIADARTDALFSGEALDVLSQANASRAAAVIDAALTKVTSIRADVGALQSRFNFASANIQIAVQNQDAAQSALLDTDIASESTLYATAQVKLQAGISVLAQANQQLQALLKLIG